MLQDDGCMHQIIKYDEDFRTVWMLFQTVLKENDTAFPPKYVDKDLFFNVYRQVITRCFGYQNGLSGETAMIPMADNLNHSSVNIRTEMLCKTLHLESDSKNPTYYRTMKYMADYEAAFDTG